jgi:hypothetical protein
MMLVQTAYKTLYQKIDKNRIPKESPTWQN